MNRSPRLTPAGCRLYLMPAGTRMPHQFGHGVLRGVVLARVQMSVRDVTTGRAFAGWGETPLSVDWAWPSATIPQEVRSGAMERLCLTLAEAWSRFDVEPGHAFEIGHAFLEQQLPELARRFNADQPNPMPPLAVLVASSAFDLALHDACGQALGRNAFDTLDRDQLRHDLAHYLEPAANAQVSFAGKYPCDFLAPPPISDRVLAWHTVGGTDPLEACDLHGDEPNDGHPILLADWIRRDGLRCLKIKVSGTDVAWDYGRLVRVAKLARAVGGVRWLSADFNCTARSADHVVTVLDKLRDDEPEIYGMLLYVEQPFPSDLHAFPIDAHAVGARKPLFLDEAADDWRHVRFGRELGWTGVALKTCKTLTGALLSCAWARAHGMQLMVQDLTNPRLATIAHLMLAQRVGTMMGVEANGTQFCPAESDLEARVHPGVYRRRDGCVDLSSLRGSPGFGCRVEEIGRPLPKPAFEGMR